MGKLIVKPQEEIVDPCLTSDDIANIVHGDSLEGSRHSVAIDKMDSRKAGIGVKILSEKEATPEDIAFSKEYIMDY